MSQDSDQLRSAPMSLDRGPSQAYEAYNQEAFQHFMTIECKRAERSGRSILLLLVELRGTSRGGSRIAPAEAARLFAALTGCLREIDFIGWYRSERVIGAVLTQGADAPAPDTSRQIGERVADLLGERLPPHIGNHLSVRALQLRSRLRG